MTNEEMKVKRANILDFISRFDGYCCNTLCEGCPVHFENNEKHLSCEKLKEIHPDIYLDLLLPCICPEFKDFNVGQCAFDE